MEHLKKFLQYKNSSEPVTYGYNYKVHVPKGYHSGGASYVLSKEALTRFYHIHEVPESPCREEGEEDVLIGHCLRVMKVYPGNSLDSLGREMFHPYNFSTHFSGPFTEYMYKWAMNPMIGVSH
jgi:glycoprotein-N-acetylgalactosamine 3-beta-galactosyltransferase